MLQRRGRRQRRLKNADYLEIRRRLSEGETFTAVGEAVGCSTKTIQRFMRRMGGLLERSERRSPLRLSPAEREEVSRGLKAGDSLRQIGRRLGRAASTISREVASDGDRARYRAWRADEAGCDSACETTEGRTVTAATTASSRSRASFDQALVAAADRNVSRPRLS